MALAGAAVPRRWLTAAVVVAVIAIVTSVWYQSTTDRSDLLDSLDPAAPDERVLDAGSAMDRDPAPLIAARRLIVRGVVDLPSDRILVADELIFEGDARIVSPSGHLTVLASRIVGADVDVSGRAGAAGALAGSPGADGGTGGTRFVAAESFMDSRLRAQGGAGGDGRAGASGARGRDGYCGPGRFRLAEPGATGGAGGAAGDGGSGGLIKVLHGSTAPRVDVRGGARGQAGRGGAGGQGGAGCEGVRGVQDGQPAGNEGAGGRPGSKGGDGVVSMGQADFADVADAFDGWLEGSDRTAAALRERLLRVESGSEAP